MVVQVLVRLPNTLVGVFPLLSVLSWANPATRSSVTPEKKVRTHRCCYCLQHEKNKIMTFLSSQWYLSCYRTLNEKQFSVVTG